MERGRRVLLTPSPRRFALILAALTCVLSLGTVHECAEIRVNGHVAGGVWLPALTVDIARWVRKGKNRLEIRVGNLMINRFIGLPDQDLKALRAAYGNRFPDPQEKALVKDPLPSGLLGPVALTYTVAR